MELRPGYRQSEVGAIPDDWHVKPLSGQVAIAHGYGFQSQYFLESYGQYLLMTPGHFYHLGGFRDLGEKQKFYVGPMRLPVSS